MRKIQFATGSFYHIYNRGVEKRQIFSDRQDYCRFIHNMYEFNDSQHVINARRRFLSDKIDDQLPVSIIKRKRDLIVEIHCYCIMPNHFHLILRQIQEGGIIKFMHKLDMAYAKYFNQKNKRTGVLFEGRYRAKPIEKDEYMMHLSRYIHLNPMNLFQDDWKERGIADREAANAFLEEYRWSSYPDYIGIRNFPSVTETGFVLGYFGGKEGYRQFVNDWRPGDMERVR